MYDLCIWEHDREAENLLFCKGTVSPLYPSPLSLELLYITLVVFMGPIITTKQTSWGKFNHLLYHDMVYPEVIVRMCNRMCCDCLSFVVKHVV